MKNKTKGLITGVVALSIMMLVYFPLCGAQKPCVVMISLDGFRSDYPEMVHLATFDSLAKVGVRAQSLKPAFPSITFPNHYTMATGLYSDHHGIVANSFYDPTSARHYSISDRSAVEDAAFYGGEPVWVTAEKQGVRTASFFWVGSEAPIRGRYPTYWKKYDQKVPFSARVDTVISWLSLPVDKRPQLVMMYYHEPDASGHRYGPESKEMKECLVDLDHPAGVGEEDVRGRDRGDRHVAVNFAARVEHRQLFIRPRDPNRNDQTERDETFGAHISWLLRQIRAKQINRERRPFARPRVNV